MINNSTLTKWAAQYKRQRTAGAPGWANGDSYGRKRDRITEALSEHSVPPPASLVELGCGAGNIALWMATRGFAAFGVDIVPDAIQWAKDSAKQEGLSAQFTRTGLAQMPMFLDGQFDIVFDGDCFHMITGADRAICFREVWRVLKPGGLLIAGGNVRDESITEPVSLWGGKGSFNPATRLLVTPDGIGYVLDSETDLCEELRLAGFTTLCVKHHSKIGGQQFVKEFIAIHATR